MSGIRYEEVPALPSPPVVAATVPAPVVAPTQAPTIPQPGTVYVETETGGIMPAPPVAQTAVAPTLGPTVSTQGEPIPQPGRPLVEIEPGNVIPAPPAVKPEDQVTPVEAGDGTDTRLLLANVKVLRGWEFVNYVKDGAQQRGLIALVVFADVWHEGINGKIGDGGLAYGPTQDHLTEFKGRPWYGHGKNNHTVNVWAWSDKGADYWLDQMQKSGAPGKNPAEQMYDIVHYYEKPGDIPGETARRYQTYLEFARDPARAEKLIADNAHGPTDGLDSTGEPVSAPTSTAPKKSPVGTLGAWRDLLDGWVHHANRSYTMAAGLKDRVREALK